MRLTRSTVSLHVAQPAVKISIFLLDLGPFASSSLRKPTPTHRASSRPSDCFCHDAPARWIGGPQQTRRAEHAAIPGLDAEHAAACAPVEKQTGISRHRLILRGAAHRTGDCGSGAHPVHPDGQASDRGPGRPPVIWADGIADCNRTRRLVAAAYRSNTTTRDQADESGGEARAMRSGEQRGCRATRWRGRMSNTGRSGRRSNADTIRQPQATLHGLACHFAAGVGFARVLSSPVVVSWSDVEAMLKPVVAKGSSPLFLERRHRCGTERRIQIGELSRQTGCTSRRSATTSGYHPTGARSERRTLCTTPPMFGGWPIRRARDLGFTLDEVRALLALSANDRQYTCAQVRELAAGHLTEVRAKIADLRAMERILADAVRRCTAGELPGCPIMDALSAA
jgi:MerR family mercuric resistance operon transcriptional regulator